MSPRHDLSKIHHDNIFVLNGQNYTQTDTKIFTKYSFTENRIELTSNPLAINIIPETKHFQFEIDTQVPRLGLLMVGWGGNNGSTLTATLLAHRLNLSWKTRDGLKTPNYYGSLLMAGTMMIGKDPQGSPVHIPIHKILPFVSPESLVIGGWDINAANLKDACDRARVLEPDLLRQLEGHLESLVPWPSYYDPKFIAMNQSERANHVIPSSKLSEVLAILRNNIRTFKEKNKLDSVIVLWTANTERYAELIPGVNDTSENLLTAINNNHEEISPSTLFAVASVLEGCPFINGSPQNTFVPGIIDLAVKENVAIGGDDFKSGQTKLKSAFVDFLISSGIKPLAITSYNHLGNNDGKNLSEHSQFKSKEISKASVVDDMVFSNNILYKDGEHPDHTIVIKYVPSVGDSKRALDEYENAIYMNGRNTISIHNTCEDSLLAAPLMLDLVLLTEFLANRVKIKIDSQPFSKLHSILSLLSFMLKAPLVPDGKQVVNSLFKQRLALENFFRAILSLPPQTELHWDTYLPN